MDTPDQIDCYQAGQEAPACFICDNWIQDLTRSRVAFGNKRICSACTERIETEWNEKRNRDLVGILMSPFPTDLQRSALRAISTP